MEELEASVFLQSNLKSGEINWENKILPKIKMPVLFYIIFF